MYINYLVGKVLASICFSSNSGKMVNQLKFIKSSQAKCWDISQIIDNIEHHVQKLKALTQNVMDGQKVGIVTQAHLDVAQDDSYNS